MLHLKLAYPIKYSWAIPVSGDFHYQFHFASGIHRLAYLPFLKWFVDATGMHKTIPKAMDDTKHIKYMDHFYQLVIKSVLTYLTDVYGHEYMSKKPSEILEEQKLNNGERVLLRPPEQESQRGGRSSYRLRLLLETPVWSSLDLAHLCDDITILTSIPL